MGLAAPGDASGDLADITGVFAESGTYRSGEVAFNLKEPGVYRFQRKGMPGQQVAVLPDTPRGVASIAAEIGVLGNLDRNKPWAEQVAVAKRRRLSMHCVQFSELSVRVAHMAGLSGLVWIMWNYEALERGDFLSSHAISEIRSKDGREVRLFDLSFGVEFTVLDGETDFPRFQAALMDGASVSVDRISRSFGFEYGSKFFGAYADDFELDVLAGDDDALLEAHSRLVRGSYVVGKDSRANFYATPLSKAIADAATDLDGVRRAQMDGARILGATAPVPDQPIEPSRYRLSADLIGYRLSEGVVSPLVLATGAGERLDAAQTRDSGILLTVGAKLSVGGDTLDLSAPGLHRFKSAALGRPVQALTLAGDPAHVAASLLEAVAAGGLHDAMPPADLRLAAQNGKVVTQAPSVADLIVTLFETAKVGIRVWSIPTILSDDPDWPVAGDLRFLEIGGSDRKVHLFELGRRVRITLNGEPCTFAELEDAVLSNTPFEISPACATPGLSYGTVSATAGLSMDVLLPLWFGSGSFAKQLIIESLRAFPGQSQDVSGRLATTSASKKKAAACLAQALGSRDRMISVLDCKEIGKKGG